MANSSKDISANRTVTFANIYITTQQECELNYGCQRIWLARTGDKRTALYNPY